MSVISDRFAILGAPPLFSQPVPVGQLYFPDWERYSAAMGDIFSRRYYTNQGPLCRQLEESLQEFLKVRHAICVTNGTIGLMMAAEALQLSGKVILPSFTFIASAQSLLWCGLQPVFCDIGPGGAHLTPETLSAAWQEDVRAVMAVNLWGGACDIAGVAAWADERKLALYFDSAQAFGCAVNGTRVGNFGELEVMSFHATKIINATEGGCIVTNDDELAKRLRNIRSSYGAGPTTPVVRTGNGRMSEAQAAIALMSLHDFESNRANNRLLHQTYESELMGVPGVTVLSPDSVSESNYQYMVLDMDESRFGLSRDRLIEILHAENIIARRYFFPGAHRHFASETELPLTDALCKRCIQLPLGARTDVAAVKRICSFLAEVQQHAPKLVTHHE